MTRPTSGSLALEESSCGSFAPQDAQKRSSASAGTPHCWHTRTGGGYKNTQADKSPEIALVTGNTQSQGGVSEYPDNAVPGSGLWLFTAGLSAWTAACWAGALASGLAGAVSLVAAGLALLACAAGSFWPTSAPLGQHARPVLLTVAFPLLTAIAVGSPGRPTPAPLALGLVVICWGGFVALCLSTLSRRPVRALAQTRPGRPRGRAEGPRRRPVTRGLLLLAAAVFGIAAIAIAPALGSDAAYARDWGEASRSARTMVAAFGGALALIVVGAFVGPTMRRRRRDRGESRRRTRRRAIGYLVVSTAFAGLAWYLAAHH